MSDIRRRAGEWTGANRQMNSARLPPAARSLRAARALTIAASIFALLRMMRRSARRRATSAVSNAATRSMENPANASRNASRLRRIVNHDKPDWKPSRTSRSNIPSSSRTGRPHSVSWYWRYSGAAYAHGQRGNPSPPVTRSGETSDTSGRVGAAVRLPRRGRGSRVRRMREVSVHRLGSGDLGLRSAVVAAGRSGRFGSGRRSRLAGAELSREVHTQALEHSVPFRKRMAKPVNDLVHLGHPVTTERQAEPDGVQVLGPDRPPFGQAAPRPVRVKSGKPAAVAGRHRTDREDHGEDDDDFEDEHPPMVPRMSAGHGIGGSDTPPSPHAARLL